MAECGREEIGKGMGECIKRGVAGVLGTCSPAAHGHLLTPWFARHCRQTPALLLCR